MAIRTIEEDKDLMSILAEQLTFLYHDRIFLYKKNTYKVVCLTKAKNPSTKEWMLSLTYTKEYGVGSFTRCLNDFLNKFIEVVDTPKEGQ